MERKIVFITNILRQPRCIRRINDFIERGYNVKVYGYDRVGDNRNLPSFEFNCLGKNSSMDSYLKRFHNMRKSIVGTLEREGVECIYYIFSLDIAIATLSVKRDILFCYEISDLMELQVKNKLLSNILVYLNRKIIKRSILNIYTSEGFVNYLDRKNELLDKTIVLPNKLNRNCLDYRLIKKEAINLNNIKFGFTGAIRTETIYKFIEMIGELGKHEVHLYGIFTDENNGRYSIKELVDKFHNVYYHGPFKNPDDFPYIYSNIDIVLSYYNASRNDMYLEPNKLYESIFYECPIIVSDNTFVGNKVKKQNIGYTISDSSRSSLINFVNSINESNYLEKLSAIKMIPKEESVDNPKVLFERINSLVLI